MSAADASYLCIRSLSKTYGHVRAVRDIDLDIAQGEMVVLLGPSGCGKTTMLRLIAGFIEASGGQILLEGQDYAGLPPYQRDMGLVFQSYALFPHMTVAQNVGFGLRMRKQPKQDIARRVTEALELVKLGPMADRYPRQLSGGQQQRVALARALAIRPKLLLLDEPLSNLDANLRRDVAREIRHLQRSTGLTTLMVTHDQDEAMMMADRLVLLKDGSVQQQGTQEELYESPANPFVARFIGHSNLVSGTLAEGSRLACDGGDIQLAASYVGTGRCTLAVRPERMRLASAGEDVRARLTVDDATYTGSHVEYLLSFPGGATITLRQPTDNSGTARRYGVGELAEISWDPASERLFDAGDMPLHPSTTSNAPLENNGRVTS